MLMQEPHLDLASYLQSILRRDYLLDLSDQSRMLDDRSTWTFKTYASKLRLPTKSCPGKWRKMAKPYPHWRVYLPHLGKNAYFRLCPSDGKFGHKITYKLRTNGYKRAQIAHRKRTRKSIKPPPGLDAKTKKGGSNYIEPDLLATGAVDQRELSRNTGETLQAKMVRIEKAINRRLKEIDPDFEFATDEYDDSNVSPASGSNGRPRVHRWQLDEIEGCLDLLINKWTRSVVVRDCEQCGHPNAYRLQGDDSETFDLLTHPPFMQAVRELAKSDTCSHWPMPNEKIKRTREEASVKVHRERSNVSLAAPCREGMFKTYRKKSGVLYDLWRLELSLVNSEKRGYEIRTVLNTVNKSRQIRVKTKDAGSVQALLDDVFAGAFGTAFARLLGVAFKSRPTADEEFFCKRVVRALGDTKTAHDVCAAYIRQGGRLVSSSRMPGLSNFKNPHTRTKLAKAGVITKHNGYRGVWVAGPYGRRSKRQRPRSVLGMETAAACGLDVVIDDFLADTSETHRVGGRRVRR